MYMYICIYIYIYMYIYKYIYIYIVINDLLTISYSYLLHSNYGCLFIPL